MAVDEKNKLEESEKLPVRDFFLIPLIAFVTILSMYLAAELLAGSYFYEKQVGGCGTPDAILPYRYSKNCSFENKAAEGPLVSYKFNECGYRTLESCGPKPEGTVRVALLGASTAEGFKAHFKDGLAQRAATELTETCGKKVEFQNMGIAGFKPIDHYYRINEAISLNPDVVLLLFTPYDIVSLTDPEALKNRDHPEQTIKRKPAVDLNETGFLASISKMLSHSNAALAAQSILFQNREQFIKLFLKHGDKVDYLRSPMTSLWEKRLADMDILLGDMALKFHEKNIPFVVVYTPQRIQAALFGPDSPTDVDPYAFGNRLSDISKRHGIIFLDTLPAFAATPESEKLFYPVDGHMTAEGHHLVGHAITDGLQTSGLPFFASCKVSRPVELK